MRKIGPGGMGLGRLLAGVAAVIFAVAAQLVPWGALKKRPVHTSGRMGFARRNRAAVRTALEYWNWEIGALVVGSLNQQ